MLFGAQFSFESNNVEQGVFACFLVNVFTHHTGVLIVQDSLLAFFDE